MAKEDFLSRLRVARRLFVHAEAQGDDPTLDPQARERKRARGAIWLTPSTLKGFDAAEFPELGADGQRELAAAGREFLEVANQIPPAGTPTPEQRRRAQGAFEKILNLLGHYLPTHPEGVKVREAVRSVTFPEWVVNWDYYLDTDSTGDPAVWVTLYIDEQHPDWREVARLVDEWTRKIHEGLGAAGVARWPYPQVRTTAEHVSL